MDPRNQPKITYQEHRSDAARESVYCRLVYSYQGCGLTYHAEGIIRDFSKTGCGVRGTIVPPVGSKTRLTLDLMDDKLPVSLDAKITWVAGEFFGVQFPEVNTKDYARIQRYMRNTVNRSVA